MTLQEDYALTEEGLKIRIAFLRKEEDGLTRERDRLERDKACSVGLGWRSL